MRLIGGRFGARIFMCPAETSTPGCRSPAKPAQVEAHEPPTTQPAGYETTKHSELGAADVIAAVAQCKDRTPACGIVFCA